MDARILNLLAMAGVGGEFETLTVDSTAKPTFPLVCAIRSEYEEVKKAQARPYQDQMDAIRAARGPSGSILRINPMFPESITAAAVLYMGRFTQEPRGVVRFCAADNVGPLQRERQRRWYFRIFDDAQLARCI